MGAELKLDDLRGLAPVGHVLQGNVTERIMWLRAIAHSITCRDWNRGLIVLEEEGFRNVYEREPDGSWSQTKARPV